MEKAPRDSIAEIIAKLPKGTVGITDPIYYQRRLEQSYPKADEILPMLALVYCAGIVDGEGTLGIRTRKYATKNATSLYFTPVMMVEMTSKTTVEYVANVLDCHVNPPRQDKRLTKNGKVRKPSWRFICSSQKLAKNIKLLLPYLITKRPQAELILEFYTLPKLHHSYDEDYKVSIREKQLKIYEKIKELNR
uniref:Homing endonuclease n=1 Tax=viral metagenome TaxID=1070528 RepID=A0A6M3KYT8_9ZZZZ